MKTQIDNRKTGRPAIVTDEVVRKLEAALCSGFSVTAACSFSGISRSTYYEYYACEKDFSDKMRLAEEFSTFKARQVILNAINKGDIKAAQWWLERKARIEFAPPKSM